MSKAKKSKPAPASPAGGVYITDAGTPTSMVVIKVRMENISIPSDKKDRTRDAAFLTYVKELAANIAVSGMVNPITLRAVDEETFQIVAGECRFEAAKLLNWSEIPASILPAGADVGEIRAAENLQRADLNDDQKALAIGDLVARSEREIMEKRGISPEAIEAMEAPQQDEIRTAAVKQVAQRFGWPVSRIRDFAFIAELPAKVRELGAAGRLSISHLKILAQVPDPRRAEELAEITAAGKNVAEEPMDSLDNLKHAVERELSSLAKAPWDKSLAFAGGPACTTCPHNSLNQTGLFEGHGKGSVNVDTGKKFEATNVEKTAVCEGICLRLACFTAKAKAAKVAMRGAGDRIADKLRTAKPAERAALERTLVSEASAKIKYIAPTVFGKAVRDRIKDRLETKAAKKSGASKGMSYSSGSSYDSPKEKAKRALREAVFVRNRDLAKQISTKAAGLKPERVALLALAMATSDAAGVLFSWQEPGKKAAKALVDLKQTLTAAINADPVAMLADFGRAMVEDFDLFDANLEVHKAEIGLEGICSVFGINTETQIPAMPVLEDFLPKAAAAPAAKSKMSPPSKSSPAAKPPGKKKAKKTGKSKMSAAAVANLHNKLASGDEP